MLLLPRLVIIHNHDIMREPLPDNSTLPTLHHQNRCNSAHLVEVTTVATYRHGEGGGGVSRRVGVLRMKINVLWSSLSGIPDGRQEVLLISRS